MIGKAHLSGNDNDNNAIDIGISPEEYDGQTVFQNVANECVFHSPDSFAPLCIRCKFLNGETVVATGKIDPTPNSAYIGSTQITIPMSDPNPFLEDDEFAANGIDDVENVRLELCGVKDKCPDIHKDKCKCDERKKDHERHYYDFKEHYDKNKNKFGKGEYSEYMNDLEDYIDEKGKYMDRSTYKMFMDYHEKFLKDNRNPLAPKITTTTLRNTNNILKNIQNIKKKMKKMNAKKNPASSLEEVKYMLLNMAVAHLP